MEKKENGMGENEWRERKKERSGYGREVKRGK